MKLLTTMKRKKKRENPGSPTAAEMKCNPSSVGLLKRKAQPRMQIKAENLSSQKCLKASVVKLAHA